MFSFHSHRFVFMIILLLSAQWKIGTNMPTKRGDFAIGVVGGKVICAGGLGKNPNLSKICKKHKLSEYCKNRVRITLSDICTNHKLSKISKSHKNVQNLLYLHVQIV